MLKTLKDYTVQMGGPIKDKAFFYASIQRYPDKTEPTGPVANSTDISPRLNVKFTLQPRPTTRFTLAPSTTTTTTSPAASASGRRRRPPTVRPLPRMRRNGSGTRSGSTRSTRTARRSALDRYSGYYNLDPVDPSPFTYRCGDQHLPGGGGGHVLRRFRTPQPGAGSLTEYAEIAGTHSFKFGAEIERSHVRSQYQPDGPAGLLHLPVRRGAGLSRQLRLRRPGRQPPRHRPTPQDHGSAGRATLNIGLRLDDIRGYSPQLKKTVYTPNLAWGPRVGLAYNLVGSDTSVLKAFWGRYYEGTASDIYTSATPGIQDTTYTPLNANGNWSAPAVVEVPAQVYGISRTSTSAHG